MTAFKNIVEAIKDMGYPYAPDMYEGEVEKYFVYNYADDRAKEFAGDEPMTVVANVQVHFFLPASENFIKLKNEIRNRLFRQGFTYPEVTNITEHDGKIRHIIFECEIEEMEEL